MEVPVRRFATIRFLIVAAQKDVAGLRTIRFLIVAAQKDVARLRTIRLLIVEIHVPAPPRRGLVGGRPEDATAIERGTIETILCGSIADGVSARRQSEHLEINQLKLPIERAA